MDDLYLILIISSFSQKSLSKKEGELRIFKRTREWGIGPTFPVQVRKVVVITSEHASGPEPVSKVDSLLDKPTGDIELN